MWWPQVPVQTLRRLLAGQVWWVSQEDRPGKRGSCPTAMQPHARILYDWLSSLCRVSLGFIHVVVHVRMSFLFKADYYSTVCVYHILCICSLVSGCLSCFQLLDLVHSAAMKNGCANTSSRSCFQSGIHPEVGLMGHKVVLFLIFLEESLSCFP